MWKTAHIVGLFCGIFLVTTCLGKIIMRPGNTAQRVGKRVVLHCGTDHELGHASLRWTKEWSSVSRQNQDRFTDDDFKISHPHSNMADLMVMNVNAEHADRYTCEEKGKKVTGEGPQIKASVSLTVLDGPLRFAVYGTSDNAVFEGGMLQYSCSVGYIGKWEPTIVFLINDIQITGSSKSEPSTNSRQMKSSSTPQSNAEGFIMKSSQVNVTAHYLDSGAIVQCRLEFTPSDTGMEFDPEEAQNPPTLTEVHYFEPIKVLYGPRDVGITPTGGRVPVGTRLTCTYKAEPQASFIVWYTNSIDVLMNCSTCDTLTLHGDRIPTDGTPVDIKCTVHQKYGVEESPVAVFYPTSQPMAAQDHAEDTMSELMENSKAALLSDTRAVKSNLRNIPVTTEAVSPRGSLQTRGNTGNMHETTELEIQTPLDPMWRASTAKAFLPNKKTLPPYIIAVISLAAIVSVLVFVVFLIIRFFKPTAKNDAYVGTPTIGRGKFVTKNEFDREGDAISAKTEVSVEVGDVLVGEAMIEEDITEGLQAESAPQETRSDPIALEETAPIDDTPPHTPNAVDEFQEWRGNRSCSPTLGETQSANVTTTTVKPDGEKDDPIDQQGSAMEIIYSAQDDRPMVNKKSYVSYV